MRARARLRRRDVVWMLAVGTVAAGSLSLGRSVTTQAVERSRRLMGTIVRLRILGGDREAAEAAADATLARMQDLESLLSRFIPDSDVAKLCNQGSVSPRDDSLVRVLRCAAKLHELGDGAFDATIQPVLDLYRRTRIRREGLPAGADIERALERVGQHQLIIEAERVYSTHPGVELTLDGIGKGAILEEGAAVLERAGFPDLYVEAGGDLIARGRKPSGEAWTLGIQDPRARGVRARFAVTGAGGATVPRRSYRGRRAEVAGCAVATSGDYMQSFVSGYRHHHILDPRTGYSAPELASATVVARDASWADGLATLAMVLGPRKGRELLESLPECEGLFVTKELDVVRTSGFHTL